MSSILQLCGAVFMLCGTMGVAHCRVEQFEMRFAVISQSERMLQKMKQKILYQRTPVESLLYELSNELSGEWKQFFCQLKTGMEQALENDFSVIFQDAMNCFCDRNRLSREEKVILCGIRSVMLSFDTEEIEAEIGMLLEEQKVLEEKLMKKRDETKRISYALGVAGGIMSVLILL